MAEVEDSIEKVFSKDLIDMEVKVKLERRRKDADDRKCYDEVFDKATLLTIAKLISDGIIDTVDFPISTGKEANVYRCSAKDRFIVLKIFRTSTATFRNLLRYIIGDPRFEGVKRDRRDIVYTWTKKEFKNLKRLRDAKVRVPEPITFRDNILVMEYIGDEEMPSPTLKEAGTKAPKRVFDFLVRSIKNAYRRANLVHGDLSEYNVLMWNEPVIIDVGQGVVLEHPMAEELLRRDVTNIVRYFRKFGVHCDESDVLKKVKG